MKNLPFLDDDVARDWGEDLIETSLQLLAMPSTGLLRKEGGGVIAFRNLDVRALAANPEVANTPADVLWAQSSSRVTDGSFEILPARDDRLGFNWILQNQIFTSLPPLHAPTRRIIMRQMMPNNVQRFKPFIDDLVKRLVNRLVDHEEIEFAEDFAEPLVAQFWASVIGLTSEETISVQSLMRKLSPQFLLKRSADSSQSIDQASKDYMELVSGAVLRTLSSRVSETVNEMASDFEKIEIKEKPENLGIMLAANLTEGFHTAALAVSNSFYSLLKYDTFRTIQADRTLIKGAFFEGTRLTPPVMATQRYAVSDIEYQGVKISQGTAITMLWAAANRDPATFDDAETYRLSRPEQGATTFGWGPHLCPGRNITRLLAESALSGIVECEVKFSLADFDYTWVPFNHMRQLSSFPVKLAR